MAWVDKKVIAFMGMDNNLDGQLGGSIVTDFHSPVNTASWHSPGNHTDWPPMTPGDVTTIQQMLYPGTWSWNGRPAVVAVNNRRITVGIHTMPHNITIGVSELGANPGPNIGHMCMWYGESSRTTPFEGSCNNEPCTCVDHYSLWMNNAAHNAYEWNYYVRNPQYLQIH